jgi:hypothetical protein
MFIKFSTEEGLHGNNILNIADKDPFTSKKVRLGKTC